MQPIIRRIGRRNPRDSSAIVISYSFFFVLKQIRKLNVFLFFLFCSGVISTAVGANVIVNVDFSNGEQISNLMRCIILFGPPGCYMRG